MPSSRKTLDSLSSAWTLLFLLTLSLRVEGRHFTFSPSGSSKAAPLPK
jgi:hypothetical protein